MLLLSQLCNLTFYIDESRIYFNKLNKTMIRMNFKNNLLLQNLKSDYTIDIYAGWL